MSTPQRIQNGGSAIRSSLAELARRHGFTGAIYVHLGHYIGGEATAAARGPRRLLCTGVLDEAAWSDQDCLTKDPLVRRAAVSVAPFAWRMEEFVDLSGGDGPMIQAMKSCGVRSGVVAPVQDYACGPAYINLLNTAHSRAGGAGPEDARTGYGDLLVAAAGLHAAAKTSWLPVRSRPGEIELNAREMDVLRLAALGSTEQETAFALSLSRRGVQFHLARAVDKLGAVNKTAAVARAVGAGLISV